MSKNTLISINNALQKAHTAYISIDGVTKKVSRGYIGVDGVAKLFHSGEPVLIFENSVAGTYPVNLAAGKYEITLIGAGGGAAGLRSSRVANYHYAQGGVGGTLQFIASLPVATTIQVVVGTGGATKGGTFADSGVTSTGVNGTATTITGFANLTMSAGGGTAGKVNSTSSSATNKVVGTMGATTILGSPPVEILINNPTIIVSLSATTQSTQRRQSGRLNANWPEDQNKGKSGDFGWANTSQILQGGSPGFVRIKML